MLRVGRAGGAGRHSGRTLFRHNRGTDVIEAGNIRFGLEKRVAGQDGGMAIHVLGDIASQEVELLAFDCFSSSSRPASFPPC